MPWDLEVVFSGLCLFYLPRDEDVDSDDITRRPQVLLVDTDWAHCGQPGSHLHQHEPLLAFEPRDLDDLSVDSDSLLPTYIFSANERGDHLVQLPLKNTAISLELSDADESDARFRFRKISGAISTKPRTRAQERGLQWVATIHDVHEDIRGIRRDCLEDCPGCPVTSRMMLTQGELGSHRLGLLEDDYTVWEFYPYNQQFGKRPVVQALADQVSLRFDGLRDVVTVNVVEGSEKYYLRFPADLDASSRVRLAISNLPAGPEAPAEELLTHYRAFYDLVEWSENKPKPTWEHLPAPRPWTRQSFLGSNGNGLLCPCTKCD